MFIRNTNMFITATPSPNSSTWYKRIINIDRTTLEHIWGLFRYLPPSATEKIIISPLADAQLSSMVQVSV